MTLRPRPQEADPLTFYLAELGEITRRGDAREESYYSSLEALLLAAAAALGRRNVRVTTIPKRTHSCQLDFQVWRGGRVAGYVEAKHPRTDLAKALASEQVQHYLQVFPNLLLTNFYRFLLLRGDRTVADVEVAQPYAGLGLGCVAPLAVRGELLDLLAAFLDGETPRAASAADLATGLARRTRVLAGRVEQVLEDESGAPPEPARAPTLTGFYRIFADHLIRGLTRREFADLYAQTVAYGLLIARWRAEGPFTRRTVFDAIPPTLGLLRDLFRYTALGTPPPEIAWVIEDLVELLAASPVPALLHRAYHESNGRDPILHFYETFLSSYDRDLRRRRGVYYTPLPVASFVVRSVHHLLAARLGLPGGLAHPDATLLDPAAGTLTFLVEAFRVAIAAYRAEAGEGGLAQLVGDHLLRHFHGFELMMAPYVIGHLKLGLLLAEWGLPLDDGQRVQLYLTDALEREPLAQSQIPGVESLSRESHAAARIKLEQPIAVVLGNPPYSGHSASAGSWLRELIAEPYRRPDGSRCPGYREVDGAPLSERNPKWLQDDYVKFLRYAQWKVDQHGWGIAALVTNHGYLTNPTFRGLRRSLLDSFDEIYLLDLGGSRFERRPAPEAAQDEPDENVFPEVSRGIVIALLVKLRTPTGTCKVLRAELRGRRTSKLRRLDEHHAGTLAWAEIAPAAPAYLFHARDAGLEAEYRRGLALDEIFPLHSAGVVTARDVLALAFDEETLRQRMRIFLGPLPDDLLARALETPLRETASWRLAAVRRRAREDAAWPERLTTLLFRPFDQRHLLYADYWVERPRRQVMRHLLGTGTPALVAPRQHKEAFGALVTAGLAGHKAVSAADVNSVFPLILQPEGLFGRREPNLAPGLLDRLGELYGRAVAAEEVLAYVYGVLYSPGYRARYAALLRRDFARVPFARDPALFEGVAGLGQELVDLHLGRSPRLWPRTVRFPVPGSGKLGPPELLRAARPRDGRVAVNAEGQAFEGVLPEVWEYRIGGTRVLPRWLAARAGRRLTLTEIEAFRQTATALQHTLELERRLGDLALDAARDPAALAAYSGSDSRSTSRRP